MKRYPPWTCRRCGKSNPSDRLVCDCMGSAALDLDHDEDALAFFKGWLVAFPISIALWALILGAWWWLT